MEWCKKIAVIIIAVLITVSSFGQIPNWQNQDLQKDSLFGISTEKAYNEFLKNKDTKTVIVAIIDSGTDTLHDDLQSVLWKNPRNGYYGWNYIGPETGREDVTNLVGDNKDFYDSLSYTMVPEVYQAGYRQYRKMAPVLADKREHMERLIQRLLAAGRLSDSVVKKIGNNKPTLEEFKNYQTDNEEEKSLIKIIIERWPLYNSWENLRYTEIDQLISLAQYHLAHGLNVRNKERDTASGNPDETPDAIGLFASSNLTAYHGTHVAGIIGGLRKNGKGLDGVADNVKIMSLKLIGTIRELRDESLAKAIRFAVDNGAKVINMSFGKPYTWNKKAVDDAVQYAMQKDVLLILAAGNSELNLDNEPYFPNPNYVSGGKAKAWLVVGASGYKDNETLIAPFSNYGEKTVDVFAPGVKIYSSIPGSKYSSWSGTSMAAPVVTGLAALIREYFPKLTAVQVKDIIMQSVVKRDVLKDKCVSGGVVNAYNALKLASTYK